MALTKAAIVEGLVDELGLLRREAGEFVTLFFEEIRGQLESGTPVRLTGFGNFELRDKHARPGRDLHSGTSTTVSARRIVIFRGGQKLRSRIGTERLERLHDS